MKSTKIIALSAVAASVLFSGCGDFLQQEDEQKPKLISGEVMDGYLKNAKVCIDLNKNKKCDTDESSTTTGAGGKYSFEVGSLDYEEYPLVVEVIKNQTIDEDTNTPVVNNYVLSTPAGKHEVISPLTTMVQAMIEANPGTSPDLAEYQLKQTLGLKATTNLFDDYIEKEDTDTSGEYTKARVIAVAVANQLGATVALMESSGVTNTTIAAAAAMNAIADKADEIAMIAETVIAQSGTINYATLATTVNSALSDANISNEINQDFADFDETEYQAELDAKLDVISSAIDDPTIMQTLLKGDGYYEPWFWWEGDMPYFGYQKITAVKDTLGNYTLAGQNFVYYNGSFVDESTLPADDTSGDDYMDKGIVLGDAGWEEVIYSDNKDNGPDGMAVTFNSDGSIDVSDTYGTVNVSVASAYELSGKKMKNYLFFGVELPDTYVFSQGARAFNLTMNEEHATTDEYRLYYWPEWSCDSTGYICFDDYNTNGNKLRYWDGTGEQTIATLAEVKTVFAYETNSSGDVTNHHTLWGNGYWDAVNAEWVEVNYQLDANKSLIALKREWKEMTAQDCWTNWEYNSTTMQDELVEYCNDYTYSTEVLTALPDEGTWEEKTIGTVTMLVLHKPDTLVDEWEKNRDTIYALYDGVIREGEVQYVNEDMPEYGNVDDSFGFNKTAMDDIKAMVTAQMAANGVTTMSTKRTSAASTTQSVTSAQDKAIIYNKVARQNAIQKARMGL